MKYLRILCLAFLLAGLASFEDRKPISASFDTDENHLVMDDTIIRKYHRLPGFISVYGEPDLKKTGEDGISQKHFYESLGIVLDVRYGSIRGITFVFNNQNGDTTLTRSTFAGELMFDDKKLSAATTVNDLKKIKYFECGRPGACYSKEFGTDVKSFAIFEKSGKKGLNYIIFMY